jgi:Ca-activated chloride channel family protein
MRFASPLYLLLLGILPLLGYYFWRLEKRRAGAVRFSDVRHARALPPSRMLRFRPILWILRLLAVALLIVAMARPQQGWVERTVSSHGIDIVLALDVSYSMKATDFQPNRLEAAKKVVSNFINGREADRISIVVFATTYFTLCPLTLDYGVLQEFLSQVDFGIVDGNSTAIGMALANCVDKLKDSEAKKKVIILLTDGQNNAGKIEPLTAAEIARTYDIKVYTIGVGSRGTALVPVDTVFGVQYVPQVVSIDEDTLREIARLTGGKYFRATDEKKLASIYEEIDRLEKTKYEYTEHHNYDELMAYVAIPALALLLLEVLIANTRFLKLP